MPELTIESLMDLLPQLFQANRSEGADVSINFDLTGEGGGPWNVRIKDRQCSVSRQLAENAGLSLKSKAQDILDIFTGKLDAKRALFFGRLKMSGSMKLAMKLADYFNIDDPRLHQWERD